MNLTLFFCEQAESRADGKLDLRGVYNELYAPGFPARQDHLVLAGIIEWDRADDGRQPFRIDIDDPQQHSIYTISGHTDVDRRSVRRPPARTHLVLPLTDLVFPERGEYSTRVRVKDKTHAGPSLHLMESGGMV